MNTPIIQFKEVTKRYGDAIAVNHISFAVQAGEIFGLLGPNGAGKTTTILMLLGLTEVSNGHVRVMNQDPQRAPLAVKRWLGYLPDAVGFYDHLSARENLAYTARLLGLSAAQRQQRIDAALDRMQLLNVADQRVATFSRGMRQRLGLAEIVVKQARIAILDEPTSGLDPQATETLLELICALKADGITILLSSHQLDAIQRICDRVALFQAGQIALMGTVQELAQQVLGGGFAVEVEAEGTGLTAHFENLSGVQTVVILAPNHYRLLADHDVRAEAARAVIQAGGQLHRLAVDLPSLNTIYNRFFHTPSTLNQEATDATTT
jgi:ABC-2 type transport system ATP-binding protein